MFLKDKFQRYFKIRNSSNQHDISYAGQEGKDAFIESLIKENSQEKKTVKKFSKSLASSFEARPLPYMVVGIAIFICLSLLLTNRITASTEAGIGYYEDGKYDKALSVFNKVLEKGNKDVVALHYKGKILNDRDKYYEAIAAFSRAEELLYSDPQFFIDYGSAYFYLGKYNDAIKYFDKSLKLTPTNSETLTWKAFSYYYLNEIDKSKELLEEALKLGQDLPFTYHVKGIIAYDDEDYNTAISLFDKAIAGEPKYRDAYLYKIEALYNQRKYDECIEFIDSSLTVFPNDVDMIWYRGDCFSDQEQHEKALEEYSRASALDPDNDELLSYLGYEYLYLKDYDKAKETANKALAINKDSDYASDLLDEIEYEQRPEAEKILEFVENNYLYLDKSPGYNEKASEFKSKTNPSALEVNAFINSIKNKNDIFTFVIHGQEYDYVTEQENSSQITTKDMGPGVVYLRIGSFSKNVDSEFKGIISKVQDPGSKTLVIDLRDNPGGLGDPTNGILDYLLPECTTSFTIDRKGKMIPYYSGESQVKFKKIIVAVNEHSASSAELLTLGLKKYLNNVVVIGKPTFGKGVGQLTYEDKEKKYMIFLVSFYWNVKEKNIAGERIVPDIIVKGSSDADYEKAIRSEILR